MSKTLVIILNHNLPEYANWLYDSLKEFQGETYDALVMDNCSKPELTPATTHIRIEQNIYWGGALNEAFKLVLKDDRYDSLLFLNNDIEFTGDVFVNLLRHELFSHKFAIVSPCIAGRAQPWKQMQNWGSSNPRIVKWIDLVAPLFHRKFIEEIGQFDSELYYGWGQELICFDVCQEKGWKTGVCDHISIVHFGMQTLVQKKIFYNEPSENGSIEKTFTLQERHALAMNEYRTYFATHPLKHGNIDELRAYGEQYSFRRPTGIKEWFF
ncbi:MAG: hypothetical protein WCP32_03965 [Bacteroidota bacterium]